MYFAGYTLISMTLLALPYYWGCGRLMQFVVRESIIAPYVWRISNKLSKSFN